MYLSLYKGFPHSSVGKEPTCSAGDSSSFPGLGRFPWRRDRLPTLVFLGLPHSSAGEESACNSGVLGSITGLGRSPGKGKGYPLQYSVLENSMDCPWGRKESGKTEQPSLSYIWRERESAILLKNLKSSQILYSKEQIFIFEQN